jgi:hypothetical protein
MCQYIQSKYDDFSVFEPLYSKTYKFPCCVGKMLAQLQYQVMKEAYRAVLIITSGAFSVPLLYSRTTQLLQRV